MAPVQVARAHRILTIIGTALLVYSLFLAHTESQTPQAQANLQFAANPSFVSGLSQYPKTWPPLYPSLLWAFSKTNIPPQYFNLLCLYLSLLVIGILSKKSLPNIHWSYVVLFIALINANYVITYQLVSEGLFVFLAFVLLYLLVTTERPWTLRKTAFLAVVSSISCLTRHFAIFWQVPLCLAYIFLDDDRSALRKRLLNTAVFCLIVVILVSPWLIAVRLSTGWFSGMDRFEQRPFYSHDKLSALRLFIINGGFLAKTLFIDFFSPYRYASHFDVRPPLLTSEIVIGVGALLLFSLLAVTLISSIQPFGSSALPQATRTPHSRQLAPLYFTFTYLLWLMLLWTLGNNDPIYTRFAYPAYPLAVYSAFVFFSWAKSFKLPLKSRLPFYVLYIFIAGINAFKAYVWWIHPS